jgi:Resolvase, N terminal domain
VYTRVSTEHGLEQEFNSLDNQREASEAYIKSQAHEGWRLMRDRYDDGGFSGGSMDRPALKKLLDDVRAGRVDGLAPPPGSRRERPRVPGSPKDGVSDKKLRGSDRKRCFQSLGIVR